MNNLCSKLDGGTALRPGFTGRLAKQPDAAISQGMWW
jgi:hypothetical protein